MHTEAAPTGRVVAPHRRIVRVADGLGLVLCGEPGAELLAAAARAADATFSRIIRQLAPVGSVLAAVAIVIARVDLAVLTRVRVRIWLSVAGL
jgi:hypothetical protein